MNYYRKYCVEITSTAICMGLFLIFAWAVWVRFHR